MPRALEYLAANGVTVLGAGSKDWGSHVAGSYGADKRWIRNSGTLPFAAGFTLKLDDPLLNGGIGIWKHALDTVTVRPPYGGAAVEGNGAPTGGHILVNGETWYFRVTRVNAVGETQGSVEFPYTIADDTKDVDLSWMLPAGPASTSIRVYATQVEGDYSDTNVRIATGLSGSATSFTWNGAAPSGGTFPAANTTASVTGPNYGTAPTLVITDLLVGVVAPGECVPFWKGGTVPDSSADVTYSVNTKPVEV